MANGWTSQGVSSTYWVVLNSLLITGHESREGYCTGCDPGPTGPWPKHSQRPKLSPKIIASPFHFGCMIDKPTEVNYDLIGNAFARRSPCPRQLVIALGNTIAKQSFGGKNQFQCHYDYLNRAYPLSGIIKLDPTYTSETKT